MIVQGLGTITYSSGLWLDKQSHPVEGIYHEVRPRIETTMVFLHGRVMRKYKYKKIERTFKSRLLNDFNLHFCGDWHWFSSLKVEHEELLRRVAAGFKPAGFITSENLEMLKALKTRALAKGLITHVKPNPGVKGTWELGIGFDRDFFDLFQLKDVEAGYTKWGIEYPIAEKLMNVSIESLLKDFDYANVEGFDLIKTGLLLGYPIETTASILLS